MGESYSFQPQSNKDQDMLGVLPNRKQTIGDADSSNLSYQIMDSLNNDHPSKKAQEVLCHLVSFVHSSELWKYHRQARVLLAYNDFTVRYTSLLRGNQTLIDLVLKGILQFGGIRHSNGRVRSHACIQLLKIIQNLNNLLIPSMKIILDSLERFLSVSYDAVVLGMIEEYYQEKDEEINLQFLQETIQDNINDDRFSINDIMNLYEAVSCLIKVNISKNSHKIKIELEKLMYPVYSTLKEIIQKSSIQNIENYLLQYEDQIKLINGNWAAQCIRAISIIFKGISNHSFPDFEIKEKICTVIDSALIALDIYSPNTELYKRIITLVHSSFLVLGKACLNLTPNICLRIFRQSTNFKQFTLSLQLFNRLILNFKRELFEFLDPIFPHILVHIFAAFDSVPKSFFLNNDSSSSSCLPSSNFNNNNMISSNEKDYFNIGLSEIDEIEYREMRQTTITFFVCIICNHLDDIFYSKHNHMHFDKILHLIIQSLAQFPDPVCQRSCVRFLSILTKLWLNPLKDEELIPNHERCFINHLLKEATLATFRATALPNFSKSDTSSLTLLEKICNLHQSLFEIFGQHFIASILENVVGVNNSNKVAFVEYSHHISTKTLDSKQLRQKYLTLFL